MADSQTNGKLFYRNAYLYFILAAAVTIFAFFPSYFNRLTSTDNAHHFHSYPPLVPYQIAFIDFATLIQFMLFYLMAIYKHKEIQLHSGNGGLK